MRITGGILRGRKLKAPKGKKTRPTSDLVRESLFNIIGLKIIKSVFLDAYAGSGAVGIEALSRGASLAVFIDSSRNAVNSIRQNLMSLNLMDRSFVICDSVFRGLSKLVISGYSFDIIFIDPPYGKNQIQPCLELIQRAVLLKPDGLMVVQSDVGDHYEHKGFLCSKTKKYGRTQISFLVRE
ncbi:MAG: 16S rRNA (guanine(966)-N(2))-methyltransferase RsmD [Tepidanaerobacteraceae bacterium]